MAKQTYTIGQVLTAAQMTTLQANDYNQTVSAKVASYTLVAADAGTRITMSNAAATTVTVNTALFTAGDTLTITNIGAGVCTITAGTATVSTAGSLALNQYDSGTLYFTSTGVSIWNGANPGDITAVTAGTGISGGGTSGAVTVTNSMATAITTNGDVIYGTGSGTFTRLGIGSSAQVLTVASGVPSWATPAASSSSFVKITGTTFSAAASVTVDSCFTSTYKQYKVVITAIPSNTGQPVRVKMRYAAGTTDSTNYYYGGSGWQASNSTFTTNGSNATSFWLFSTSTARSSFAELTFSNVGSSSSVKPVWTSQVYDADYDAGYNLSCVNYTARTDWDGFIFTIDVGTMTGNYVVYGMEA